MPVFTAGTLEINKKSIENIEVCLKISSKKYNKKLMEFIRCLLLLTACGFHLLHRKKSLKL